MARGGLLIAALLALPLGATTTARAEGPVILKFATLSPAGGPLNTRVLHPWADRINARSRGIVEIDVRDGFSVANYDNVYERVLDDVVQIAFTVTGSIAGKFVLSNIVALPMLFERSDDASVAFWRLYNSGALDDDFSEVVPLFVTTLANAGFHLNRPAPAFDDLGGLKIVASSKMSAAIVSQLKGTPVSYQQSDMYTALERKAADGTYGAWTSFAPFKLGEVTNYHLEERLGGAPAIVFMARKRFDALPSAVRKVLQENSGEAESRTFGDYWMKLDDEGRRQFTNAPGHTIVNLTPAENRTLQTELQPVIGQWMKDTPDGAQTLATYRALLDTLRAER